jgi:antitoxin (DNA-binding transcriptional repressor) of toxin-antitoxin stability system
MGAVRATSLSVTEMVRGFSDYVNRVAYRGERFVLLRGRKPVAELRPLPAGRLLGELDAVLRSLPALGATEAEVFAADIEEARARLPEQELRDLWQR